MPRHFHKPRNPNWRNDNVTPAQVWRLMNIGFTRHEAESMTKGEASSAITAHQFGSGAQYENVPPPTCSGNFLPTDPFGPCGNCRNCNKDFVPA